MEKEGAEILSHLLATLSELAESLEEAMKKKDEENLEALKSEILKISEEVRKIVS